jgi:hypothetical protein
MTLGERAVCHFGAAATLLGWRPSDFWAATPAELASALASLTLSEAVERAEIDRLRTRFPDEKHG